MGAIGFIGWVFDAIFFFLVVYSLRHGTHPLMFPFMIGFVVKTLFIFYTSTGQWISGILFSTLGRILITIIIIAMVILFWVI